MLNEKAATSGLLFVPTFCWFEGKVRIFLQTTGSAKEVLQPMMQPTRIIQTAKHKQPKPHRFLIVFQLGTI
mgnify:CR=1 FL=1